MKHVKENDLAHGQFGKWLESVGINERVAQMMMKVYSELGSKTSTYSEIGLNALYQIATIPPAEREKPHTIPSTGETKTVDEMTVRELREVKKALKEAEKSRSRHVTHCANCSRTLCWTPCKRTGRPYRRFSGS
ncbi:DUF3102 domain-containing protein [Weizmannia acidilactici]|uniref:DUF3102 domain-containing protein n=1 Tax=Weizmannia acidilactici TaxID=2607726 RepID=UPI0020A5982F